MSRDRRVLPHSIDAEASVLGGILLRNELLAQLDTLEIEVEKLGKLEAIGGVAFLGELALRVPTADNVLAYTEIVQDKHQARKLMLASGEILDRGYDDNLEVRDYLDDAERKIFDVTQRQ